MKKILVYLLLLAGASGALSAQNTLHLSVVNAKGKPLAGKAQVSLKSNPVPQIQGKDGPLKLRPFANDTIFITAGNLIGYVPSEGLSELNVVVHQGKMTNQATGAEYAVVNVPRFDPNNIAGMPNIGSFINLENLVTTKYPMVKIQNGEAYLMTNMSATSSGSRYTPMLILVDGNPVQNFAYANQAFSVQQVKSIVVKRSEAIYGVRGAGGIMEITLVSGRDR